MPYQTDVFQGCSTLLPKQFNMAAQLLGCESFTLILRINYLINIIFITGSSRLQRRAKSKHTMRIEHSVASGQEYNIETSNAMQYEAKLCLIVLAQKNVFLILGRILLSSKSLPFSFISCK